MSMLRLLIRMVSRVKTHDFSASVQRWWGNGFVPDCAMAKYVKNNTYCCYVRCAPLLVWLGGMPWPKPGATHYHAQFKLPDKGRSSNYWLSTIVGMFGGMESHNTLSIKFPNMKFIKINISFFPTNAEQNNLPNSYLFAQYNVSLNSNFWRVFRFCLLNHIKCLFYAFWQYLTIAKRLQYLFILSVFTKLQVSY